jgi:hypothetical protein
MNGQLSLFAEPVQFGARACEFAGDSNGADRRGALPHGPRGC